MSGIAGDEAGMQHDSLRHPAVGICGPEVATAEDAGPSIGKKIEARRILTARYANQFPGAVLTSLPTRPSVQPRQ
jgi:hypothetical protein